MMKSLRLGSLSEADFSEEFSFPSFRRDSRGDFRPFLSFSRVSATCLAKSPSCTSRTFLSMNDGSARCASMYSILSELSAFNNDLRRFSGLFCGNVASSSTMPNLPLSLTAWAGNWVGM